MGFMTAGDVMTMFLALAVLLGTGKLFGELARKIHQPAVIGELVAGIVLGPTILARFLPGLYVTVFPFTGVLPVALNAITTLGVVLFLLCAGLEVELHRVWSQGRPAVYASLLGMVVPFSLGFVAAWFFPRFLGIEADADRLTFALFIGTALSISALPVVARILMDLGLMKTDVGSVIVSSAMFNDLVGWIGFSLIIGLLGAGGRAGGGAGRAILLTLGFVAVMLTAGRRLIDRCIPWLQAHASWPGGVLAFIFTLTLASAAFTEFAGIHAVFGAFIAGIAVGDSDHLRDATREHIQQVVTNVLAPLFFASVGLRIDFFKSFDVATFSILFALACAGKIVGATLGARVGGMSPRHSLAVGIGLNARGAMEVILGLLAVQYGLIKDRMFASLVMVALLTSLMSAPGLQLLIHGRLRPGAVPPPEPEG